MKTRLLLISFMLLFAATAFAQKEIKKRIYIYNFSEGKIREFVPPEQVGVEPGCPFPTLKNRIWFRCPICKLGMSTHVLYPHLPHCPRCSSVMFEEDAPEKCKKCKPKPNDPMVIKQPEVKI